MAEGDDNDGDGDGDAEAEEKESDSDRARFLAIPTPPTPPVEPPLGPGVTRIQFRHASGRVIRRFALDDRVESIYAWLKAQPLDEAMRGKEFECVCLGKNLLASLHETVQEAGLRNGTVMVGYKAEEEEEDSGGGAQ
ncbi:hypothetical protein KEM52_002778 [Ascosphaera acerosa]|nr:hypothetical protein KEM52_002778 [Ascosphaera acerosa]